MNREAERPAPTGVGSGDLLGHMVILYLKVSNAALGLLAAGSVVAVDGMTVDLIPADALEAACQTPASSFATPLWRAGHRSPTAAEALATAAATLRWKLPNCEFAVPKHWFDAPTGLAALNLASTWCNQTQRQMTSASAKK